jgi:hypothetical protein
MVAAKPKLPTSSMNETTPSPKTPSECANDASTRMTNASKQTAHPLFGPGPSVVVRAKKTPKVTAKELAELSKLDRRELYLDRITNRASKGE